MVEVMERNCPEYLEVMQPEGFANYFVNCIEKDFTDRESLIQIVSTDLKDIILLVNISAVKEAGWDPAELSKFATTHGHTPGCLSCIFPVYDQGENQMSKYDTLWEHVQKDGRSSFKLTFDEIHDIAGIPIDHSFLKYKKEIMGYGYQVGKISMKEQTVVFNKIASSSDSIFMV